MLKFSKYYQKPVFCFSCSPQKTQNLVQSLVFGKKMLDNKARAKRRTFHVSKFDVCLN